MSALPISPTSKSKVPPNRLGRGAQFINMIRNKKPNALFTNLTDKSDKPDENVQTENTNSQTNNSANNSSCTNVILKFGNRSSPPGSILKRKFKDTFDEPYSISAVKRKRVSFHDPPVSATKEYTSNDDQQEGSESNGKINLENKHQLPSKHILKRTTRTTSLVELEKYANELSGTSDLSGFPAERSRQLFFEDEECVLDHVINKYAFDELLEKYLTTHKKRLATKASKVLANSLKHLTDKDSVFKSEILENLSEYYPKEFLEFAVRENLSSTVCQQLNPDSIIEYIFHLSAICKPVRKSLLTRIHQMDFTSDLLHHFELIFEKNALTADEILKCIRILATKNPQNST